LDELRDRQGNKINAQLDVSGLARLLVETRGSLLHFTGDTKKSKGTPINHLEFEEIAEVVVRIAG
jgi:Cft2 family RNA processing exonuclease